MEKPNIFETERLIIKPVELRDAPFFLELYNTPNFIEFIGDKNLKTVSEVEKDMENRYFSHYKKHGFGNFSITLKESGQLIGAISLVVREETPAPDIGFSFLPEFQGKGYGYEAAQKILRAGFEDFSLNKISAMTTKENTASQKLIEKLGLKFQKIVRIPNDPEDLLYMKSVRKNGEIPRNT